MTKKEQQIPTLHTEAGNPQNNQLEGADSMADTPEKSKITTEPEQPDLAGLIPVDDKGQPLPDPTEALSSYVTSKGLDSLKKSFASAEEDDDIKDTLEPPQHTNFFRKHKPGSRGYDYYGTPSGSVPNDIKTAEPSPLTKLFSEAEPLDFLTDPYEEPPIEQMPPSEDTKKTVKTPEQVHEEKPGVNDPKDLFARAGYETVDDVFTKSEVKLADDAPRLRDLYKTNTKVIYQSEQDSKPGVSPSVLKIDETTELFKEHSDVSKAKKRIQKRLERKAVRAQIKLEKQKARARKKAEKAARKAQIKAEKEKAKKQTEKELKKLAADKSKEQKQQAKDAAQRALAQKEKAEQEAKAAQQNALIQKEKAKKEAETAERERLEALKATEKAKAEAAEAQRLAKEAAEKAQREKEEAERLIETANRQKEEAQLAAKKAAEEAEQKIAQEKENIRRRIEEEKERAKSEGAQLEAQRQSAQRAVQEAQEAIAKAQEAKAQLQAIKEEAARAAEQKQEAEKAVKAAKDEKARLEAEAVKRAAKEKAQKQLAKEKEAARQQRDEAIAKAKAQREAAVLKAREEREAAVAKAKEDRAKAVKKAEEASRAKQDSDKKDDTYSHAATTREIKRRIAEMEAKLSSYYDKKDDR